MGRSGTEKVKCSHHLNDNFFCLASLGASLALQYGGFLPREWLAVKGLFRKFRPYKKYQSSELGNFATQYDADSLTEF